MITAEVQIVYRAAGRRWLTLRGAARAEAKAAYRRRAKSNGEQFDEEWVRPRIDRLARMIYRAARHPRPTEEAADA